MVVEDVELEERRRALRREHMPGRRDHDEDRRAERRVQLAERQGAHPREADHHDQEGEHEAEEPLGQHTQRRTDVEQEKPGPASIGTLDVAQEPVHGEREAEDEELIGGGFPHVQGVSHEGGERDSGQEPRARAVEPPPDPPGEEHGAERGERRPEAHRPLRRTHQPEGRGGQPEVERRLLEIGQTVDVRDDPVVLLEHLLRDRRVEPFVGIEEGHPELEEKEGDAERHEPGQVGGPRGP